MKNSLIITALLFSFGLTAQEESKEAVKDKKIEVIKIIDGDTVMHTIKEINAGEFGRKHERMAHHKRMDGDMSLLEDEIEMMIEDIDICIKADGMHKKMIIHQMKRGDEEIEDLLESLESDENILIEFEDGRKKMKVMKIKINGDNMEEITTIELGHGDMNGKNGHSKGHMNRKGKSSGIKAYPNPTKDHINLEFEVFKGNAELKIRDMDGKVIFNKTYKEAGEYQEQVKLKNNKNEILLIELKEERRFETRKIIVD